MNTCPDCGKSYDPSEEGVKERLAEINKFLQETGQMLPGDRVCGFASFGTPRIVTKEEINSRADEDRALRDRLAMDLFRDDRSKDGYFEAETSARVALDDADIFMAERAKRDKDHGSD